MIRIRLSVLVLTILAGTMATAGCVEQTDEGHVALYVKDAPKDNFLSVFVTFGAVRLHQSGAADANGTDGAGWRTIASTPQEVDLLAFTGEDTRALLGNATLAAGRYQQILIEAQSARGILRDDEREVEIQVTRPEVRLTRAFNITEGQTTMIVIDIDLDRSLVAQGNGRYRLQPVIGQVLVDEDAEELQRSVSDQGAPDDAPESRGARTRVANR